ncbi:MAG: hypothetical protein RIE31_11260 [Alphaproteobacteria bacterium]
MFLVIVPHIPATVLLWANSHLALIFSESVAYRFGFVTRLLDGENSALWLPQGFATSLIQKHVAIVMRPFMDYGEQYIETLKVFADVTLAIHSALLIAVQLCIVRDRNLRFFQKMILLMLPFALIFATRGAGIWFWTSPDYYALNTVFFLVAAYFGCKILITPDRYKRLSDAARLGAIVGIMIASKISFVLVALAWFVPLAIHQPDIKRSMEYITVGALASVVSFAVIVLALYYPSFEILPLAVIGWWTFLQNPGNEFHTLSQAYFQYVRPNNYDVLIALYVMALATLAYATVRHAHWKSDWRPILAAIIFVGATFSGVAFLWVRAAGSTAYEAMGFLSVGVFGILAATRLDEGRFAAAAVIASIAALALLTFPLPSVLVPAAKSASYDFRASVFETLRRQPDEVNIIIPDNAEMFVRPSAFEDTIVKGFSDIPSWVVRPENLSVQQVFPGFQLRSEHSALTPSMGYRDGSLIVFYGDTQEGLAARYPTLAVELNDPATRCRLWESHEEQAASVTVCRIAGGSAVDGALGQIASLMNGEPTVDGARLSDREGQRARILPLPAAAVSDDLVPEVNAKEGAIPYVVPAQTLYGRLRQIVYPDVPRSVCTEILTNLNRILGVEFGSVEGVSATWRNVPVQDNIAREDCRNPVNTINLLYRPF